MPRLKPGLFLCGLFGLTSLRAFGAPDPAAIETIRARYAHINRSLVHCATVTRDVWGQSAEGGEMTGYRSGASFCKVTVLLYGEMSSAVEEYYFSRGALFFAVCTTRRYNQPLGTVVETSQERLYLSQGTLIRWLGAGNRPQAVTGSAAHERDRQLHEDARRYLTLLAAPANAKRTRF